MPFKIKIICFGTKRNSFQGEVDRFSKMLKPFGELTVDYLKPITAQISSVDDTLRREQKLIESKVSKGSYLVVLAEEGHVPKSSKRFAKWLGERKEQGQEIVFVMGSAYGVRDDFKAKSDKLLSLSPLTMPYSLCLVVLIEQIYRAYTILSGHPYHK